MDGMTQSCVMCHSCINRYGNVYYLLTLWAAFSGRRHVCFGRFNEVHYKHVWQLKVQWRQILQQLPVVNVSIFVSATWCCLTVILAISLLSMMLQHPLMVWHCSLFVLCFYFIRSPSAFLCQRLPPLLHLQSPTHSFSQIPFQRHVLVGHAELVPGQ